MDPVSPPNIPDDSEMHAAGPPGVQEPPQQPAHRAPPARPGPPAYDSISILTTGPANDTDSIHTGHPATDGDSIQTAHPAYDTDSTQTAHLTYDTDSNRTLNPAYDTDSTRALHPAYVLDQMTAEGAAGPTGAEATGSGNMVNPSEDPPPYSPPDPKLAYLIYPPPLPHYPNQPVIACQPGANTPAFYQPSFLPPSTYPSYAIYMNGPPLGEEQTPLPKDYLVESLLVTIFCCLMSGLVALMYSYETLLLQTRAALARGDIREGEKASQKARLLVMFSLMFGVFVFVGWIIYVVIAVCA
ncbi:proline rich transmembrane protein 1B isoform X1 [Colossoma macropomum]|uniref:proline rich transmembrane protein 1B isoform X1 n=1 Tax=Colossoma macropomum TaxID=42526 RepID=UPI001863FFEA|nr:proline rich transmembrane protein 1B isoform X1 [Colossoma macropomum]